MSRNFELLSQIVPERQTGANGHMPRPVAEHVVLNDVAPTEFDNAPDEELRRFVRSVFLSSNGHEQREVMFCGVDGGSESSSVCARTARILAATSSKPVCIVEANLRSPRLSGVFGIKRKVVPFDHSIPTREQCSLVAPNLWLTGVNFLGGDHGMMLPGAELKHRLAKLRDSFAYVLVDGPGASASEDVVILGQAAGVAILVIEANSTRKVAARKAKETLEQAGVRVLGSVLNNRTFPIPENLYSKL